jgi:phage terminase large subunit GpA-like protein
MSGGGDDKSRAGFSSRVLVITETDGMDAAGEASREADKITQLRARTESYDARARTYMECTVSIEQGRTWREYTGGTQSRIALPCPHCRCWVAPEREHLQGWQDAATDLDARAAAQFCCPACGVLWSDAERSAANHAGKMVHRGQDIDPDGVIHGESPRTSTLGFRWSAVNNLFWSQGHIGAREWRAARDPDEENAAKEMLQFVWALPHQPDALETTPLEFEAVKRRVQVLPKGVAPADTQVITVGADLGKWLGHFVAIAWRADGSSHVLDYGVFEIDTDHLGVERATLAALRTFRDFIAAGWAKEDGGTIRARQVWIDSGYSESRAAVYLFCRESAGQRFRPVKGYGAGQERNRYYQQPKAKNKQVRFIGEGFHVSKLDQERVYLVEVNADHWKSWVHERLVSPVGSPGAMVLYQALPGEHTKFAKHMTAEKQVEEFVPERGVLRVWKRVRKQNHLFDAIYNACAAGNFCGVRLLKTEKVPRKAPRSNVETVRAVEDDYGEVDRRDFFVMEQE